MGAQVTAKDPVVSIVIPTRNRAHLLGRTLQVACAQEAVTLEVIVIDDGSTDATRQVVSGARDGRVRFIRHELAQGVSAARNRGITAARGEWIAFLDDDDLWAPDKLVRQLTAARETGSNWVYGGDVNVDGDLRVLSGGPPPDPDAVVRCLPRWNPLASGGSNIVVRASVLHTVGGFDPELRRTEDWDLWIRLAGTGPPAWVCEPLVAYRFHPRNVSENPAAMVDEARLLAARYDIPIDFAAMYRRAAWNALRSGRRALAAGYYAHAVARGDGKSLARIAFALLHPSVGTERIFRQLGRDTAWVEKAEHWLDGLSTPAPAGARSDS